MSIINRILSSFGKSRQESATVIADRERQKDLHGMGLRQSQGEADANRSRMEAELDQQRTQRGGPPA